MCWCIMQPLANLSMYSISQEYYNFDMHAEDAYCLFFVVVVFVCGGWGHLCFGSDLEC